MHVSPRNLAVNHEAPKQRDEQWTTHFLSAVFAIWNVPTYNGRCFEPPFGFVQHGSTIGRY